MLGVAGPLSAWFLLSGCLRNDGLRNLRVEGAKLLEVLTERFAVSHSTRQKETAADFKG